MNRSSWMSSYVFAWAVSIGSIAGAVVAAEPKPSVVVSIAGYDALMSDIDFLGETADAPQLSQTVEGFIKIVTNFQGLAGLDKGKPIGLAVSLHEQDRPAGYAFIPVTDSEALLDALQGFIQIEELDDGFKQMQVKNGRSFVMTEKKGWIYVGLHKDHLANLPSDPSKLLGDLPTQYDLAVRINVRNVPEELINSAFQDISEGAEPRLRGETDEQYEARKQTADEMIANLVEQVRQVEQFTLGITVDSKTRSAYLDSVLTMQEGSEQAGQINEAAAKVKPTRFGGLTSDANPAGFYLSVPLTKFDQKVLNDAVDQFRGLVGFRIEAKADLDAEAKKTAAAAADDSFDVVETTIGEGVLDTAVAVLKKENFALVGAAHVTDGAKLEGAFRKWADLNFLESSPRPVRFEAGRHQELTFHTVEVPIDDKWRGIVGDASLAVGFGKNTVVVCLGENPIATAVEALAAQTGALETPSRGQIHLAPVLAYLANVETNDARKAVVQSALNAVDAGNTDRVIAAGEFIRNGRKTHLKAEEGVLKATAKLIMQLASRRL